MKNLKARELQENYARQVREAARIKNECIVKAKADFQLAVRRIRKSLYGE